MCGSEEGVKERDGRDRIERRGEERGVREEEV